MKTKLLIAVAALLISIACQGQATSKPPSAPVDTLKEFRYLYKGQPMPFDSGVAVSHRQYMFLEVKEIEDKIDHNIESGLKPLPEIVYVNKEVRKKGDGNILTWSLAGTVLGIVIGILSTK